MERRNDRIHARVRITDDGYVLYDWRTRKRLEIHLDQIMKNIQLAINAKVTLEAHITPLISHLKLGEELDKLLRTLPEVRKSEYSDLDSATA